jgi:hypothetical protein
MFYNLTFGQGPSLSPHPIVKTIGGPQHKPNICNPISEANK